MYQPLHPAVLRMVRDVVQVGRQAGISVAMCGEMAGDPLYIPVLLGLGVEEFSMNTMAIPVAKRVIRMTKLSEAKAISLARPCSSIPSKQSTTTLSGRWTGAFRPSLPFGRPLANKLGK